MESIFQSYIKKQYRTIKENVNSLQHTFDSEVIHDIRLAIKKLRALSYLIQVLLPDSTKAKHLMDPLTDMYKSLGVLRDVEVKRSLVQHYQLKHGFNLPTINLALHSEMIQAEFIAYKLLKGQEVKGKKLFINRIEKIAKEESKKGIIAKSNSEFIRLLSHISKQLIHGKVDIEAYHEIRRSFKNISYIYQLLRKEVDKNDLIVQPERCKPIEKVLGNWHDRHVLLIYCLKLTSTLKGQEKNEELMVLQELINVLNNESEELILQFRQKYFLLQEELDEHF